jgi:hypothetical protein
MVTVPAIRHGLIGIDHEVVNHLGNLALIDIGRSQIVVDGELAADIGPAQGELCGLAHQFVNTGDLFDRRTALGEGEQLLGQVFGPQGRFFHLAQRPAHRMTGLHIQLGKGQIADDAG